MEEILTGGYEHHVEADYLKNKPSLEGGDEPQENKDVAALQNTSNVKFKINKSNSRFMTETLDNYRAFVLGPDEQQLLVDYRNDDRLNQGKLNEGVENHYVTTYLKDYANEPTHFQQEQHGSDNEGEGEEDEDGDGTGTRA